MEEKLDELKNLLAEIADLDRANALLGWDQQVYMPRGGAEDRGNILATVSSIAHQKSTSDELGRLLDELKPYAATLDPESDEACLILRTAHEFEKARKIPNRWVADFARESTIGQTAWEQAKAESNFSLFQPHLERMVDLRREYASFFKPYEHVYDPLLDDFESGLKTSEVQQIFGALRPEQIGLVREITAKPRIDDGFLNQTYDEKGQKEFGLEVSRAIGFDFNRGREDVSVHPFTTSFGIDDVRITTHFLPEKVSSAIFSTIHETGHGLYEQGISTSLRRTPLATGASMAIHESQSRMWENIVGRSRPFWKHFYPRLQEIFPGQLSNVGLDEFYRAINSVTPSYIRTEAVEATYNLHIMLRMELEIALMEGSLPVKDVPQAWNAKMQEFLGITPPNDRLGVLQDVHWSGGMFGYFPTYALGNLISAQIWERITAALPDVYERMEQGEFLGILEWLRENLHKHGAKFEPQELIQRVTGSKIQSQPYISYLRTKYSEIYRL
jgi:carboxypeptidase Taq